jgi:hypothetical protein
MLRIATHGAHRDRLVVVAAEEEQDNVCLPRNV